MKVPIVENLIINAKNLPLLLYTNLMTSYEKQRMPAIVRVKTHSRIIWCFKKEVFCKKGECNAIMQMTQITVGLSNFPGN